jgi:uncharacterized delta-60 repeat protein
MNLHYNRLRGFAAATILGLAATHAAAEPADGVLDPTFGDEGITTVAFDIAAANPIDVALDAVADSFGRTYLVGIVTTTDGQRIGITRLRPDGTVDTNYGPDDVGLVVAPEQLGFSLTGVSAAIAPDGRLLVGGTLTTNGNDDFALCRFDVDGSLDAFPNGLQCVKVAFDLSGEGSNESDVLGDIAVQPDGKIVMVGSAVFNSVTTRLAAARLDTNGDLDVDFNGTGRVTYTTPNSGKSRLDSVAIQTNGKIVAGGNVTLTGFTDTDLLLMRLLPGGTIDTTFSEDGYAVLFPIQSTRDHALAEIALLPTHPQLILDQTIIAVGSIETGIGTGLHDGLVARINPDGTPNEDFNATGYRVVTTGHDLVFNDIKREDNGNYLIAGTIVGNANPATTMDFFVTRLLPSGSTDVDGFNPPSGYSLVNVSGSNDIANALALQKDRIIVAGGSLVGTTPPNLDFSAIGLLRDRIFANGFD